MQLYEDRLWDQTDQVPVFLLPFIYCVVFGKPTVSVNLGFLICRKEKQKYVSYNNED